MCGAWFIEEMVSFCHILGKNDLFFNIPAYWVFYFSNLI